MDAVTPQQAVEFMLEQKGMSRSDLDALMGGKSRVSEFVTCFWATLDRGRGLGYATLDVVCDGVDERRRPHTRPPRSRPPPRSRT